jgi:uncharacterized membrane protein YoaK (UPF0700 family)
MRSIAAVVGGFVAWWVVATVGNFAVRALIPGYADVERAMNFTLDMQVARLVTGALASLVAGWVTARIARGSGRVVWALVIVLLALFIPVHYGLWDRFPPWYHLIFLASLVVATLAGAALVRRRDAQ